MTLQDKYDLTTANLIEYSGTGTDLPVGPWSADPDLVIWNGPLMPLMQVIQRNQKLYILCGYVELPPNHPLKKDGERVSFTVHGGITYAGHLQTMTVGSYEKYFVGFDCGHGGDFIPAFELPSALNHYHNKANWKAKSDYKDVYFVMDQLNALRKEILDTYR